MHVVLTAHGKGGGTEQNRELGKFGDLQIHEPQIDPASRAVYRLADAGHKHQNEKKNGCSHKPRRKLVPHAHRHATNDVGRGNAQCN